MNLTPLRHVGAAVVYLAFVHGWRHAQTPTIAIRGVSIVDVTDGCVRIDQTVLVARLSRTRWSSEIRYARLLQALIPRAQQRDCNRPRECSPSFRRSRSLCRTASRPSYRRGPHGRTWRKLLVSEVTRDAST
jgi:hypothetical protein